MQILCAVQNVKPRIGTGNGGRKKMTKVRKVCPICGVVFFVKPSVANLRKCDKMECRNKWLKQIPHTKEWRDNQSKSLKGRKITWADKLAEAHIGLKASESTKELMRVSHTGERNNFYGRKHKVESKQSISKTRIERGVAVGNKNPQYIDGRSKFPYCDKFDEKRKRAVRTFFGVCICCGKTYPENIIKRRPHNFDVHHIDHDKEQGCSGKPFNLVPLCRSCHSLEGNNKEEYRKYINRTLNEGFKWGIWSKSEYERLVMYS